MEVSCGVAYLGLALQMGADPRVAVVRHAAEVASLDAGDFERAVADGMVRAASEAVEHVFLVGVGGQGLLMAVGLNAGGGVGGVVGSAVVVDEGVCWGGAGDYDAAKLTGWHVCEKRKLAWAVGEGILVACSTRKVMMSGLPPHLLKIERLVLG